MAVVTGDRYLERLVRFVEQNAGPLLEGSVTLKLNPVGLHYVQSRLEVLRELEGLIAGAPVDYLRAYVSDLGDHRVLEQLRRILRLLTTLKIISVLPSPARDPTPLSLLPFPRLRVLELRGCDLSTSAARGLLDLRHSLEKFICHNSTDALRHAFASRIMDVKDSPVWNRLSFVSCACNDLVFMDESLQLLPAVETLDLSRNRFAKVDNLRKCTKLKHLDLGFNHLRTIATLSEVSCPIVKLVLRNNALTSLRGLQNLKSVEGLDLSCNIISSFSELKILASLPGLRSLWLEGNPICCARWYRAHVFSFFSHPEKLKLDERGISTREYWERHVIFAKRQNHPAGYGFYFPAKDDAEDDDSVNTKRKKNSRLASIAEDEHWRFLCLDIMDQESVSCDSNNLRKDENGISDTDLEIVDLMNRVEYMKKEGSVFWLREFKEWLDLASEDTTHGRHFTGFNLEHAEEKLAIERNDHKYVGESSKYISDTAQVSESESSSNLVETNMSFPDNFIGHHGNGYVDANGRAISDIPITDSRILETSSKQDQLKVHTRVLNNLSPLESNSHSNYNPLMVEETVQIEQEISPVPLAAFDEIMGSRSSSIFPGSPPHYQQDILNRRLYLEEEFFQLSAESLSVASSDSDTSCSDDSCRFHAYVPELDFTFNQESTEQGISSEANSPRKESTNHGNQLQTDNNLNDLSSETEQTASEDAGCMVTRKGKSKPKRRVATLEEEFVVCNTEVKLQTPNGFLEVGISEIDSQGELSCNEHYIHDSCRQAISIPSLNEEVKNLTNTDAPSSYLKATPCSCNLEQDDVIKDYSHVKIADTKPSETCEEVIQCGCIYQVGSGIKESEVALVRSCKNNLYILLLEAEPDGQGTNFKVLRFHRMEDIKEVVVGLGLQTLRVQMEGEQTYMFLPRTLDKSRDLLSLLRVCDYTVLQSEYSLRSWEQIQVKLLEKCICGSLKAGIFLYSMLLFSHEECEGESWVSRSLFVIEGYIIVCFEDLVQFGSLTDVFGSSPMYYSLDSSCSIQSILELVIELDDNRCLTLIMDHHASANMSFANMIDEKREQEGPNKQAVAWKLKWFSQETMLKFVALVKAIYLGLTSSTLPVKCIS